MPSSNERQPVSTAITAAVETSGLPVGFCEAPAGGGYQGEFGKSDFVPYSVITPQMSSGGMQGPLSDPQADSGFVYAITSFAPDAVACEWMADQSRASVLGLMGHQFSNGTYVTYVWVTQFGAISRDDSVSPPFFAQTDVVTVSVMG